MANRHVTENDVRRQMVNFSFFRVMPEWRRLPYVDREEQRCELVEVVNRWTNCGEMNVLSYSLVGLRSDADFMVWRICYSLECLQRMTAEINNTQMAGYLEKTGSYLGTTRHSQYIIPGEHRGLEEHGVLGALHPGGSRYLAFHPFVKTREWYWLPFETRQHMVRDHLKIADDFPNVRLNIIYSFGMDDQEFIMALESNRIEDFVDINMRQREIDNYRYVARDTPVYTCVRVTAEQMLENLG